MGIARYWGNSEDWYTGWGNYTQNKRDAVLIQLLI